MLKLKISFPVTTKEETWLWSRFKCSFFRKYNCRPELIRSRQLDFLSCFIIYLLSLYTSVLHTQLRFPFGLKFRTTKIFYFSIYFRYTFSYSSLSLLPHQLQDFYHSFLQNAFFSVLFWSVGLSLGLKDLANGTVRSGAAHHAENEHQNGWSKTRKGSRYLARKIPSIAIP